MLITAETVVTGRELLRPGWIDVDRGRLRGIGAGAPPRPADVELGAVTVVPGFVDMHVHGGGGGMFPTTDPAEIAGATATAVDLHRRHGTTTMIASLVTAHPVELLAQVRGMAEQVRSGLVAGIHLEGPWLAAERCGAHELSALRDPDPDELDRILAAGDGTIRMVTLAPERTGGLAAIRRIVDAGAVAAVGHTEATYAQTLAAVDAGATVATHLFNAMRPVHHREPGPVLALMEDPRVTLELITDGVHLHPALYREVCRSVGTGPGGPGHRRDGRGGYGRRGLPARVPGRRRHQWDRKSIRNRHHRRKHGHDGPGLPIRSHHTVDCPARPPCWPRSGNRRSTPPGRWAYRRQGSSSAQQLTWWFSTPN